MRFNPLMKLFSIAVLSLALTAASARAADAGTGASFKGPVGLQLYSLRADFIKSVPTSMEKVKSLGIKNVEMAGLYNLPAEKVKEMLGQNGLRPVSGHFPFERYRDDVEGIAKEAKALGLQYVGTPWIPHSEAFDEQECRAAIAVFNKAGEALSKHGLRFFYHVHGYEFAKHGSGTFLDLLMAETKPEFVAYQMDVLWVLHPGFDPAKILEKFGKRWELMHIKDLRKGIPTGPGAPRANVTDNVPAGSGQVDWPSVLKAAEKAGVKWYFIEDESPDAATQIPQTLKYLEQVKW